MDKNTRSIKVARSNINAGKRNSISTPRRVRPDKTARIGESISKRKSPVSADRKLARIRRPKTDTSGIVRDGTAKTQKKTNVVANSRKGKVSARVKRGRTFLNLGNRKSSGSKSKRTAGRTQNRVRKSVADNNIRNKRAGESRLGADSRSPERSGGKFRSRIHRNRTRKQYRERHQVVKRTHRNEHVYRDRFNRTRHTIVHPGYRFGIHYRCGRRFRFSYFWPYYHRKYVFISLGGYWPIDYYYTRYYWYGYHPYSWYGYDPIAREVQSDTHNYYTYNYYDTGGVTTTGDYGRSGIDENTFADVRERLAQQSAKEPAPATLADTYFEDGVKAFEIGGYNVAAEMFAKAMELAPDDMILPFAYSQALLAGEKYAEAAAVLRIALLKITPEKEGVFYPRGLYPDEETVFTQIDRLTEKADLDKASADLQLLLGYQLLGIGETEEAIEPLQQASLDTVNSKAAMVLLELAEKLKAEQPYEAK